VKMPNIVDNTAYLPLNDSRLAVPASYESMEHYSSKTLHT
jgi:hypothetical protein